MLQSLMLLSSKITELFEEKDKLSSIQCLMPLINDYAGDDWKRYVEYTNDCYARNYVYRNEDFEILVICWKPGQGSPIHNHADRGCVLKVLEGELVETRYFQEDQSKRTIFGLNQFTYIDNHIGLHKISNQSHSNTVSLHIYSPGYFIPQTGDCVEDFGLLPIE